MSRPTTKEDLLIAANTNYDKLMKMINSIPLESRKKNFTFNITEKEKEAHWTRDKNIKDVLIHLYEWHNLLINWFKDNINGTDRQFLKVGYNWKTYGAMNMDFFNDHKNTSYEEAVTLFDKSHKEVISIILSQTNEQLFSKGIYSWTGGSTLGQYCISVTSSHYDWAMKKIKKHIQTL